ncbi:DUF6284 family protein [Catellatospora citrea]|uniref:Uncharacterized protein n=1 Tax=Catellatospora citrea TaxID=53366 RepID=A0A8J3P2I4_9ACTN|nr:DUF6284 family protein [Catellatospora citrea]RKE08851.1 hypothetical protein C8E86_3725 [Catellatospora citrea]GIG01277.1 hypothetical protein Cci01nite_63700 [Catellatospora citrea]
MDLDDVYETGPTDAELAAIELEWPLIAAELELTSAEITVLTANNPTELDWRRLRRAERQRLRALADLLDLTAAGLHAPAVDGRCGHVATRAA